MLHMNTTLRLKVCTTSCTCIVIPDKTYTESTFLDNFGKKILLNFYHSEHKSSKL